MSKQMALPEERCHWYRVRSPVPEFLEAFLISSVGTVDGLILYLGKKKKVK